jgi:hypothetical protein
MSIVLFSLCGAAVAQEQAEKPVPAVGEVREFADKVATVKCQRWEITELSSDGYLKLACGDFVMSLSVDNDYNPVRIANQAGSSYTEFKPFFPELSFPLQVAKKWNGRYSGYTKDNGARWDGNVSCEVVSFEDVVVKAGSLKAFRIDCEDKWSAGAATGTGHSTRWYSPAVKSIVKVSHKEDSRWNMELIGYTVQ